MIFSLDNILDVTSATSNISFTTESNSSQGIDVIQESNDCDFKIPDTSESFPTIKCHFIVKEKLSLSTKCL